MSMLQNNQLRNGCVLWSDGCNEWNGNQQTTRRACFWAGIPSCHDASLLQILSLNINPTLDGSAHWESGVITDGEIAHVHMGSDSIYCGIGVVNEYCNR